MESLDELKQEALDFIRQADEGDFNSARRLFSDELAQALPEDRLKDTWQQLTAQAGSLLKVTGCEAVDRGGKRIVIAACQFEKAPILIYVVFNPDDQISGLNYQPDPAASPYTPPAYAVAQAFHEVELTVGSGEWALPATLSLPQGSGPFPAVVLVHGSGPQDRDESLGPNKPFRDLAWGLASQGIVVLRYEKRTKAYIGKLTPEMIARMTVQEEVIDDALAAVRLLRQTPGIDPSQIYVLGHSLGATLAPRIGQQDPAIAGLVVLAGLTRPLEDTILDQFTYIYNLSGEISAGQKAELEQLKAKVMRVKDPDLSARTPATDLPLDIHPAYWLSLRGYQPAEVARSLAMRILVLQGGRDYQVTLQGDFPAWQQALATQPNAALKVYPRLFHMFFEGDGPSTPQEYMVEGHVSAEVIRDIASWIKMEAPAGS